MTDTGSRPITVRCVIALVELQDGVATQRLDPKGTVINRSEPDDDRLNVYVSLSAETSDGRRISSGRHDFGISGPRHGIDGVWHRYHGPRPDDDQDLAGYIERNHHVGAADIEDGINQMLGRDPDLHRPPRLSWGNLIEALADQGIAVAESDLIDAPLTIDLHPDVQAELERG